MAQQPQGQSGDNSMAPIWLVVLLFFVAYIIWIVAHQHIVSFVFFLNVIQAKIVHFFVGGTRLEEDIYLMQTLNPASVRWQQFVSLLVDVGDYVRYPVMLLLVVLAFVLYKSDVTLNYHRAHSMKSLREQEQQNWPAIMPVVGHDLVAVDINTGPWAMALTPMEFARKHHLLKKNDRLMDGAMPGEEMTASIRRGDAKRVFTLQLGPVWDGFERCPPHARALAAIFMARMNRDKESALALMRTLDESAAAGKPNYGAATPLLKKHMNSEQAQTILSQHAYLLTCMASLLMGSRDDGVMPSSEFLWLKTVDRRMWYMLNCVGRQTPFVEVGGPFAHWIAERTIKRRSLAPMIDEAIRALELAIKEIKLSPKELQELEP